MCIPCYYIGGTSLSAASALQIAVTDLHSASHVNSSSILLKMTIANLNQDRAVIPVIASYVINMAAHIYLWWQWKTVCTFSIRCSRHDAKSGSSSL
jgi:hypothetical protein